MKNLILGVILGIAISFGIAATSSSNQADCSTCGVYCDNSKRVVPSPEGGGGDEIPIEDVGKLMADAEIKLKDPKNIQRVHQFYILSKNAIEDIFNNDNSATGIAIAPYFDSFHNDSLNLLVLRVHTNHVITSTDHKGLAYKIKTFCPEICDLNFLELKGQKK